MPVQKKKITVSNGQTAWLRAIGIGSYSGCLACSAGNELVHVEIFVCIETQFPNTAGKVTRGIYVHVLYRILIQCSIEQKR